MYRSLTLSDEQEAGQLLAAPLSIPAVYDDGQTEVLGRVRRGTGGGGVWDVYIMQQQQQQNEGDIASDPAHYPFLW